MKILLVASKPPYPPADGGAVATWQMALGLVENGHRVHALAMATAKHPDTTAESAAPPEGLTVEYVPVDTRASLAGVLANLPSRLPYSAVRFDQPDFTARLHERVHRFAPDVVQFDTLPPASDVAAVRAAGPARVVLRPLDLERRLWAQRAAAARWPQRLWWAAQARRYAAFERACWQSADGLIALNPELHALCGSETGRPVLLLPPAVSVPPAPPAPGPAQAVFHIGAMDWWPNVDGVRWLLADVWPRVRAAEARAELYLAGRRLVALPEAQGLPGVQVDGEVQDASAYSLRHGVLVVPVRAGTGVRNKIIEALALARAVVSTPVGASGLGLEPERHLLVAEQAPDLAGALLRCVRDPQLVARLGQAGWEFALQNWSRGPLMRRAVRFFESLGARP